jgi:6-phosphofructokinase 1
MGVGKRKRIAVMTGGGDAPGLNAVIRGVAKTAIATYGWEVMGVRDGGEGLLAGDFIPLDLDTIRGIAARGGTILGTTNRGNPFAYPISENGDVKLIDRSGEAVANLQKHGIDALVAIGGDGGLKIAHRLAQLGVAVVGVPKTIDNDLLATDQTFGFETAVQTATDAIDKLETTAEAHHRVMVVEVMGRDSGWIALHSGMAGSANAILIPEIPFELAKVAAFVQARSAGHKTYSMLVVAEGAKEAGQAPVYQEVDLRAGIRRLGGIAVKVGEFIAEHIGLETRVTVLGHIQRGGSPTANDRVLATRYGVEAAHLVAIEKFDHMVALQGGRIVPVPLAEATGGIKVVDPQGPLVRNARELGICFGDAVPSPLAARG